MNVIEAKLEKAMYASRWLLAPLYIGLSLALILLSIKFFQEVVHFFPLILAFNQSQLVIVILSMVDMALGRRSYR